MLAEVGVTQAALLGGVLIATRRGHPPANRLLASLILTIGGMIGLNALVRSPFIVWLPHLIRVNHPLDFLPGPLLYLYVQTRFGDRSLRRADFAHFLPAVLCALYLLPYYLQSGSDKVADLSSPSYSAWYFARSALAILFGGAYVLLAVGRVVRSVRRNGTNVEPPDALRAAASLKFLCAGFLGLTVVAIARYIVDASLPAAMPMTNNWLPAIGTFILCGLTYCGLRESAAAATLTPSLRPGKYETSTLTEERAARGQQALIRALESRKVFLDPQLTLKGLASQLGIPASHLSQIINERLGQNFTDLINHHRVEEAKRRLVDPTLQHYSIVAIAEEVGFRSKSSFNAVFKRHARVTPSAYRQHHRPEA